MRIESQGTTFLEGTRIAIVRWMLLIGAGMVLGACEAPLPEKPKPVGGLANPAMAEQRMKDVMANPNFTQAQKDQMIATIKQKNHMQ